jgi:hypothetical protein
MKSKLDITEFRDRLKTNTKTGIPELKVNFGIFSIFFFNSKCFYGKFDDSTFRLSINSNFNTTFYILKGKYKNGDNKVNLNYNIEPMSKIGVIWMKFFPFVVLIGVNCFFCFNFKNAPNEIFIVFNLFIVFIVFFSRWKLKREKKNLELKFNKIFEVID